MDMALLHVPFSHGFDTGKRYPVTTIPMLGLDCDWTVTSAGFCTRFGEASGHWVLFFFSFKEYIDDDHR